MATSAAWHYVAQGLQKQVGASLTYANRFPISRLPEITETRNLESLSPRPLAFVLNVVLIDLQPLLSKGN
jgi:hypothetical protein